MTIGEYLREARKKKKVSLAVIGKKLGVTRQYMSLLELDKQQVPVPVLEQLIDLLDLDRYKAHILNGTIRPELYNYFVKYQDSLAKVIPVLIETKSKFEEVFKSDVD